MANEMVEKVARIIRDAAERYYEGGRFMEWAEFEDDARAAIATMRDVPDSVADKIRFKRFPHSRAVYEAIIDTALDRETVG